MISILKLVKFDAIPPLKLLACLKEFHPKITQRNFIAKPLNLPSTPRAYARFLKDSPK